MNKKIRFSITLLFLLISSILMFHTLSEKKGQEDIKAESNTQITINKNMQDSEKVQAFSNIDNIEDEINKNNLQELEKNKLQNTLHYKSKADGITSSTNETPIKNENSFAKNNMQLEKLETFKEKDIKIDKKKELKCTLSVTCFTILNNMDKINKEKAEIVPKDGVIFQAKEVVFYEGESVFNVLLREMKKSKIHMEYSMTPVYNSNYIEGIANIYELDCGELSGWIYKVNGLSPNYGSSNYKLKLDDVVEWQYTCDLGRDVGVEYINTKEVEQK